MKHTIKITGIGVGILILMRISALAGSIGGVVDPISTLTSETYFADVSGGASADGVVSNAKIASVVVDNNNEAGWKLTVTSANNGSLKNTVAVSSPTIAYSNIKLVKTGGVLGAGLADPNNASQAVTSGSTIFQTSPGAQVASTATVAYALELQISWSANTALLSGTYSDTITMTLASES
ncbi:MAG: hypothetical protein Q7R35_16695 [Elusimicrobiota bacterium]|nr:hypothetical protein [Elusimicrobiota bacterium]